MTKFGEVNRAVEAHSECILFLYLQDARGQPVQNVRLKLWAGPPPTGQPPYYVDDDPGNMNRRTDLNGKFQFIVANPTSAQALDFYVQVVGDDGQELSDPIHFPFHPHEARWVIVTMAPVGVVDEKRLEPSGISDLQFDRGLEMKATATPHALSESKDSAGSPFSATKPESGLHLTPKSPQRYKLFSHYLLFGPGSQAGTLTNLILALDYIIRYSPVVGFSADEARNAEHVTLVGDTMALASSIEQSLRDAGCLVTRVSASDSYALEQVFKQLIDSGSPYPSQ